MNRTHAVCFVMMVGCSWVPHRHGEPPPIPPSTPIANHLLRALAEIEKDIAVIEAAQD